MNRVRVFIIVCALFMITHASGITLHFEPAVNDQKLDSSAWFKSNGKLITVDNLRFYISEIKFSNGKQESKTLSPSFYLLDFLDGFTISDTTVIENDFNKLSFRLGIDSITNVSGALGGDLDPTNGMYWTWQSGYVNFKMEGQWKLEDNKNVKENVNLFEFHLGGYQYPFSSSQVVSFNIEKCDEVRIYFAVDDFFAKVNLSELSKVMSPCQNAVLLSRIAAESFHLRK